MEYMKTTTNRSMLFEPYLSYMKSTTNRSMLFEYYLCNAWEEDFVYGNLPYDFCSNTSAEFCNCKDKRENVDGEIHGNG